MAVPKSTIRLSIISKLKKAPRKHRIVESVPPIGKVQMHPSREVELNEVNPLKKIGTHHV